MWGILYIIFPSKVRIVERTFPGCKTQYTIQQKHEAACNDTWDTLEEAQKNLSSFNGTKSTVKVVYQKEK